MRLSCCFHPHQHTDRAEQLSLYTERARATPYLACWCALDDMTTTNGSLLVVKQSALLQWQASQLQSATDGDDGEGVLVAVPDAWLDRHSILLLVPAGSVVLFDADFWHASGGNTSDAVRRVFYVQYSLEPIAAAMQAETPAAVSSTPDAPVQKKKLRTEEDAAAIRAGSNQCDSSSSGASDATAVCAACGSTECVALTQRLDPLSFAIPCALD